MKKINRITSIALIFMLIGVFLFPDLSYSEALRVPFDTKYTRMKLLMSEEVGKISQDTVPPPTATDSELANIALIEFNKKYHYLEKKVGGGTTIYFDASQHWDFVVKEANKPNEFKNREELYPIAPDAFIPWLTLDKEKKLWVEELVDPISVVLEDCRYLFYKDKKEEAELKIKELADIWADKYLYLIQRGIKCPPNDTIKMDDFGRSQATGEWGFFDFGALIKAEAPSSENEVPFAMELGRSLSIFEMELEVGYPKEFAEWWKNADKYLKLKKKLNCFKEEWKEIWNTKPPENKFPKFRSKYLESLTVRQADASKSDKTLASGYNVTNESIIERPILTKGANTNL